MGTASSSPSSSSPEQLIDGAVKTVVCLAGCGDEFDGFQEARGEVDGSAETKAACFEAGEALRKCMRANAAAYESYVPDADKKQQQGKSSQA